METTEEPQQEEEIGSDPVEGEEKKAPPTSILPGLAPETVNLVPHMAKHELETLGSRVVKRFEKDWKSSTKFRKRRASILKLFLGDLPPIADSDAIANAQIHYPIIAKAVQRIHARIYDQQFPSDGQFFGVYPTDATDQERAIRVAKHLNWQINHQIDDYVQNHDALIMQWLLYGSAFSYVCWDSERNRPKHIALATEDVVLAYRRKSTDPSLADVPRITRILRLYRHELEDMQASGYYTGIEKLFEDEDEEKQSQSEDKLEEGAVQEVVDKDAGVEKPAEDGEDAPRILLEQHCWYKFTGEKRQKPVVVTVDKRTKKVLCVKLREDEDPIDKQRYNRQEQANTLFYEAAIAKWRMDMELYSQAYPAPLPPDVAGPPVGPEATDMTVPPAPGGTDVAGPPIPAEGEALAPPLSPPAPDIPPPPPKPLPPDPPAPVKMVPIHFFTHYVCIPNPEGIYGFGIGSLLEGHNIAADTIASQLVDAGTLANTKGGLISRQMQATKGDLRFRPGEFIEVETVGQKLSDLVHMLDFAPPDASMGALIRDQEAAGDAVSSAGDILSGEVGGSNETATTTKIRIGEAMTAVAIEGKRYSAARSAEGQKIARLNSVHLGDDEYFTVVDPYKQTPPAGPPLAASPPAGGAAPAMTPAPAPGTPSITREPIARIDYLKDVDIMVTANLRMASQGQRIAEAQSLLETFGQNPFFASQPIFMTALAKKLVTAIDDPALIAALDASTQMMFQAMAMGGQPPAGGPPPEKTEGGEEGPPSGPMPASGTETQPATSEVTQ